MIRESFGGGFELMRNGDVNGLWKMMVDRIEYAISLYSSCRILTHFASKRYWMADAHSLGDASPSQGSIRH